MKGHASRGNYSKLNSKLFKILYGGCAGGAHFSWGVGMVGGVEKLWEVWGFLFEGLMGIFVKKITRFLGGGAHRRGPGRNRGGGRWRCAGATRR